jgi:hypothetical protein
MLAATQAAVICPVIFCEIDTAAGNIYMWNGYGNFSWNGQVWIGGGNLVEIGSVTEQNKVMATGCALSLSGVDIALVAAALEDLERYLPARLWIGAIDENFNLINAPYQFLNGRVDTADITQTGKTATITVTAESRLVAMRFPRARRYTDLDQRLEHPGDGGFSFVDTIQDASINWHG